MAVVQFSRPLGRGTLRSLNYLSNLKAFLGHILSSYEIKSLSGSI